MFPKDRSAQTSGACASSTAPGRSKRRVFDLVQKQSEAVLVVNPKPALTLPKQQSTKIHSLSPDKYYNLNKNKTHCFPEPKRTQTKRSHPKNTGPNKSHKEKPFSPKKTKQKTPPPNTQTQPRCSPKAEAPCGSSMPSSRSGRPPASKPSWSPRWGARRWSPPLVARFGGFVGVEKPGEAAA